MQTPDQIARRARIVQETAANFAESLEKIMEDPDIDVITLEFDSTGDKVAVQKQQLVALKKRLAQ